MDYQSKFKLIKSLINREDPVVVEIGAHYGEDSRRFLDTFKNITLYCFEPDLRNISIIKEFISDSRMTLFEYAVSNQDKESVDFYLGYQSKVSDETLDKYSWIGEKRYIHQKLNASGASSLRSGHPLVRGNNKIQVKTIRIDTWVNIHKITHIDFMWIDAQGAEEEVIKGLGSASSIINYIWIEYGEMAYNGALDRNQTIVLLSQQKFTLINEYSSQGSKGDLLFIRNV